MLFYIQGRDSNQKDMSLFVRADDVDSALLAFAAHHGLASTGDPLEVRTHLRGCLYRVFRVSETTSGVLPWDSPEGLERLEDSEAWGDD